MSRLSPTPMTRGVAPASRDSDVVAPAGICDLRGGRGDRRLPFQYMEVPATSDVGDDRHLGRTHA